MNEMIITTIHEQPADPHTGEPAHPYSKVYRFEFADNADMAKFIHLAELHSVAGSRMANT
jgi:hypothetical protein